MKTFYEIVGKYDGGPVEVIDTAETETEAATLAAEYRLAFGAGWSIWHGVPVEVFETGAELDAAADFAIADMESIIAALDRNP